MGRKQSIITDLKFRDIFFKLNPIINTGDKTIPLHFFSNNVYALNLNGCSCFHTLLFDSRLLYSNGFSSISRT